MVTLSKITTRHGDGGQTSLGTGARVSKSAPRITALGDVDELNSVVGMIDQQAGPGEFRGQLRSIMNDLFDLGADLCMPQTETGLRITAAQLARLDALIEQNNRELPTLQSFILPGGSALGAWLHLARAVTRRAERSVVALAETEPLNPLAQAYLNRLSDLFFVWARVQNRSADAEILWRPGKGQAVDASLTSLGPN